MATMMAINDRGISDMLDQAPPVTFSTVHEIASKGGSPDLVSFVAGYVETNHLPSLPPASNPTPLETVELFSLGRLASSRGIEEAGRLLSSYHLALVRASRASPLPPDPSGLICCTAAMLDALRRLDGGISDASGETGSGTIKLAEWI
mmetsp:Transcript_9177/g.18773  ORF Transcript_9177/g.18773 Transcript_9177/m.18773 type:complete len:148 (+) Transcript_9177:203-646(+)